MVPDTPATKIGRLPFELQTMLRIHLVQHGFGLFGSAMREGPHDVPPFFGSPGLDADTTRLPDESAILRFRNLLEERQMEQRYLQTINALLRNLCKTLTSR